jgi:site-specific DNA-methyltransferase (adenine-specific)
LSETEDGRNLWGKASTTEVDVYSTEAVSDLAKKWQGWGTALKPAHEPVVMARKPLEENTVVDNVLKWGTGGINIDESRIPFKDIADRKESTEKNQHADFGTKPLTCNVIYGDYSMVERTNYNPPGRFPANLILDEEAGKLLDEQSGISKSSGGRSGNKEGIWDGRYNGEVRDENPGFGDVGGASRFFYCPKVSKSERNEGLATDVVYELNDDASEYVKNQIKGILKLK